MGLRSLVDTIPAAFIESVEMSLTLFTGEEAICKVWEPLIGDIQSENAERIWEGNSFKILAVGRGESSLSAGTGLGVGGRAGTSCGSRALFS